jgi:CBS domain containing-hemolysin-like protein
MKSRSSASRGTPPPSTGIVAALVALLPSAAHASFLPPELMDKAAFYLAWFVLIVMPIAGIVLFWLVHILPEKIAHKRHHPQKDAIQTLCLLSLVFGGLLWPIAWLWAYTKPVSYRLAYGTDKADEYFEHMAEKAQAGELPPAEMKYLLDELDAIATRGAMSLELQHARTKIDAAIVAATPTTPAPAAPTAPAEPAAQGAA